MSTFMPQLPRFIFTPANTWVHPCEISRRLQSSLPISERKFSFLIRETPCRPSSFQSILIFARDAVTFLRRGPSLCSCLCYVIIVRAPKRTAGHIPGHGRSRITYISPAIRRRARIQARIESGWNNSRAGDDNLAKRRWTSINRARFIYRRRLRKATIPRFPSRKNIPETWKLLVVAASVTQSTVSFSTSSSSSSRLFAAVDNRRATGKLSSLAGVSGYRDAT